jgi:hypothetical protein
MFHAQPREVFNGSRAVHHPTGCAKHCAALTMDVIHEFGCQQDGLLIMGWVEASEAAAESEHLFHTVGMVQLAEERTDDVVQAGAQAATRDNPCANLAGIEEQFGTRARQLEQQPLLRGSQSARDMLRHILIVTHESAQRRRIPRLARLIT